MKTPKLTSFHTKPRKQMKRGGFKKKPIDKLLGLRTFKPTKKAFKKLVRDKLPSIKTTRNKADGLLTPLIKIMFPLCLLCNNPTEVAHHHVHKSKSTRLRYELDNLINLCHHCHQRLHHNESYWASKVVEMRGLEWFRRISKLGEEQVKADVHYYLANYNRLKAMKDELDKMN